MIERVVNLEHPALYERETDETRCVVRTNSHERELLDASGWKQTGSDRDWTAFVKSGDHTLPVNDTAVWANKGAKNPPADLHPLLQKALAPVVELLLPDGTAVMVASQPLPADHWLYAAPGDLSARRAKYRHELAEVARECVRQATRNGTAPLDPDALVNSLVATLAGRSVPRRG